jgi:hypothetical protein
MYPRLVRPDGAPGSESHDPAGLRDTTSPEALFNAIDGRAVDWGTLHYLVEVYGVTEMSDVRWLQLGLHGEPERMVTLRLPLGGDETSAMHALCVLLAESSAVALEEQLA